MLIYEGYSLPCTCGGVRVSGPGEREDRMSDYTKVWIPPSGNKDICAVLIPSTGDSALLADKESPTMMMVI